MGPVARAGRSARRFGAQALRNLAGALGCVVLLVACVLAFFADLSSTMREHKSIRYLINPLNSFYALGAVAADSAAKPRGRRQ